MNRGVRPSEVSKQVANNHNRYYNATVSTQMSWNYDPLCAGKHSITSQFPLLAGQLRVLSKLFLCCRTDLPHWVIRGSLSSLNSTYLIAARRWSNRPFRLPAFWLQVYDTTIWRLWYCTSFSNSLAYCRNLAQVVRFKFMWRLVYYTLLVDFTRVKCAITSALWVYEI